jgi:uncharacterized protein (TIGR00304 family)
MDIWSISLIDNSLSSLFTDQPPYLSRGSNRRMKYYRMTFLHLFIKAKDSLENSKTIKKVLTFYYIIYIYSTVLEMPFVSFFALFFIGSLMVILGIFLLIYSIFNNREKVPQQKLKTMSSGIIMVGPIPIVFGYSKWFYIIPIAAIVTIFLILSNLI